ncbi:hypothetical protein Cfor_08033 [Coptotermes formosanus]|jgi:hypothetical protein|uniref:Uncharacterized protein n=1 Tax=Coptotermes formosanus TaxID=36987 RepID=A0A6L2Q4Y9_COPFO|nr:hypothetical protein Cfor_08033 [Coptotermes formosanus]
MDGIVGVSKMGRSPQLQKTKTAVLQDFNNRIARRGLWPPPSTELKLPGIPLWRFHKESAYTNNPKSVEELEHYNEQTVAGNDHQILRNLEKAL